METQERPLDYRVCRIATGLPVSEAKIETRIEAKVSAPYREYSIGDMRRMFWSIIAPFVLVE